jgi:predicted flap endonuclease-1-like 5' DNA nuclease
MSWYTAGEIVVWMLLAAVLGFALGWLLRGLLARRPSPAVEEPAGEVPADAALPEGTRVEEIDTGEAGTAAEPVDPSRPVPVSAQDRIREIAGRAAGGLTPPHDELVRIHGVGPKLAALLESMGITSFRQVARLTPEDVAVVNDALGVFPGRIERDDWIGSARELHRQVYGVEP